jgi:RNA polymerase primary sigma factor
VVQDDTYQNIIERLYAIYKERGFLSEDEALFVMSSSNMSLVEINKITNKLFALGVLFSLDNIQDENDYTDYGFIDYNGIYKEIISIDKNLTNLIEFVKRIKPPQKNEFDILYIQVKSGSDFAKNRIIEMNMRQAVRQALYFHKKYLYPIDECIQDAFLGLVIGFEHFDISKSSKFGIHITWWIRQNLYREILIGNYLIKAPSHLKSNMYKVFKLFIKKSELYIEKNKKILINIILKILSCSEEIAIYIYKCFQKPINIDRINKKNDNIFSDNCYLIDDLNEYMTNQSLHIALFNILSTFPKRESNIIKLRYGLGVTKSHTLDEIGEKFNLTRERIRQIIKKALRRFRHPRRSKKLKNYFDYKVIEPDDKELPKNQKYLE